MARHTDGLHAPGPDVAGEQTPKKGLGLAGEEFQGFGDLHRGNQIDDRPDNTNGVASLLESLSSSAGFEKAGEAGRRAGTHGHGQAVTGNGGRVDPRTSGFHLDIVNQEASFEIV